MKYLCDKKGETSLYPSDLNTRAQIDESMARVTEIKFEGFISKVFGSNDKVPDEKIAEFEESLSTFLAPYAENAEKTGYLIGDSITIGTSYHFFLV